MYEERFYRYFLDNKFSLEISYQESDLYIVSRDTLDKNIAFKILVDYYTQIESYIKKCPQFFSSLSPLNLDNTAPLIVQDMLKASKISGIGPFSAVAGAIAAYVGSELLRFSEEIIVENGGDIFLNINKDTKIGAYLGEDFNPSFLTLKVKKRNYPFGICSSSSKIGHSMSLGEADLVMVLAKSPIIADTFATLYANMVKNEKGVREVFKEAERNKFIEAVVIAFQRRLFFWGDVELDG